MAGPKGHRAEGRWTDAVNGSMGNLALEPKTAGKAMYGAMHASSVVLDREVAMPRNDGSDGANLTMMAATVMMAVTDTTTMRQYRSETAMLAGTFRCDAMWIY